MLLRVTDIDAFWPFVKHGATQILDAEPGLNWSLEDLRSSLDSGESRLLVSPPDHAFAVVRFKLKPRPHVFVWLTWCNEPRSMIRKYLRDMEQMGRAIGAEYLEMESTRRGFARIGWIPQGNHIYRKEL